MKTISDIQLKLNWLNSSDRALTLWAIEFLELSNAMKKIGAELIGNPETDKFEVIIK